MTTNRNIQNSCLADKNKQSISRKNSWQFYNWKLNMFMLKWQNILLPAYKQGSGLWCYCAEIKGWGKGFQDFCYHPAFLYPAPYPWLCCISLWSWMNNYKGKMFSLSAFILHFVLLQWGQICFNYILHFSTTHSHQALLSAMSRVCDLHEHMAALYSDWTGMNTKENLT